MVKISELKEGDIVKVNDEGVEREGTVVDVSHEDNMACIDNGIQEFWYAPEQIGAIPLDEEQLLKLGFERHVTEDGIKYTKGPFRVMTHQPGDFSHLDVWYREDHRHFHVPLFVHELQNHYHQMTKVVLERP